MCTTKPWVAEDQPCPVTFPAMPDSQGYGWDIHAGDLCQVLSECLGWHLCGATLLTFVTRRGMGKQLVQKHPGGSLPIVCNLICLSFCVLRNSKADFKDSWMVEYVC